MTFQKICTVTLIAFMLSSVSFSVIAHADGMPDKPKQKATTLDKAINDVQNKQPPIPVTAPAVAATPAPVAAPIEKDEPVVAAAPTPPPVPQSRVVEVQPDTSFFGFSVGVYDPSEAHQRRTAFTGEYQPGVQIAGVLQPLFGVMATTEGTLMGYAGIGVPVHLAKHILLMPSAAIGAYHTGGGYDLGRIFTERLGAELAYEFDDKSRLGLNADVITNGTSTNKGDRVSIFSLVYTTPLDFFSGSSK